jgi:glycosyltransferase involved in cell wall biosynthesis
MIPSNRTQPKICHVTSVHQRYDVRIFHKECKSLANHGFDVVLLVSDALPDEVVDHVQILSTHFQPKNRIDRMLSSTRHIKHLMQTLDADLYHFHDPELLPVAAWAKRNGKKVIFDVHEDVAQQIRYKTWIPKAIRNVIAWAYQAYESTLIGQFDGVISVTPKIVDRLKLRNPQTIMVTNYPIIKTQPVDTVTQKEKAVCFAGGITSQWNHENIIKAIEPLHDVKFIVAGKADEVYLDHLKQMDAWPKVEYLGKIKHEAVTQLYAKSSIGLALMSFDNQVGDEGTLGNTKVFEFMEAGLPIICSNNKIWTAMVEKYHCGLLVDPTDLNAIREAIQYYLDHPEEAQQAGINGRKAVEDEYNWATQEAQLIALYAHVIS